MARKDIYKIDNYFIRIGYFLLIIGGLGIALDPGLHYDVTIDKREGNKVTSTYEDKDGRTLDQIQKEKGEGYVIKEKSFPLVRTIMTINGMVLLVIGYYYRSRENKIIAIWNMLEQSGQARVPDLMISLGLSRDFILMHLRDINAQQQAAFTYDSRADKIVSNKLLTEFLVTTDCTNCGNRISLAVSLDLSNPPKCPYCGSGLAADHLNQLKVDALKDIPAPEVASSEFNIGIFVFLLIFFWPGALFYLAKKKMMK